LSCKVDIFSTGILFLYVLGSRPVLTSFSAVRKNYFNIAKRSISYTRGTSPEMKRLLLSMLIENPKERLSARELLEILDCIEAMDKLSKSSKPEDNERIKVLKIQIHESLKNSEVQNAYSDPEETTKVEKVEDPADTFQSFGQGRTETCAPPNMNGKPDMPGEEKVDEDRSGIVPSISLPEVNEGDEHGGASPQTPTPSSNDDIVMDELDGLLTSINAMTNEKGWTGTFNEKEEEELVRKLKHEADILSDDKIELARNQYFECIEERGVYYRYSKDYKAQHKTCVVKPGEIVLARQDGPDWIKITKEGHDYWLPRYLDLSESKTNGKIILNGRGPNLFKLVSATISRAQGHRSHSEEKVPEQEDGAKPEVCENPSGDKLDLFAKRTNMPLWRRMLCCCCCIPCCPWLTGSG